MGRIEDLEKEMFNIEGAISQLQEELKYKQKEYALLLGEKAGKETLKKFQGELNRRLAICSELDKQMSNTSLNLEQMSILCSQKMNEEAACEELKALIADCKNDLEVNGKYQQEHLLKIMLDDSEQQPQ